ncbi:MAG: glycosyltransferase family 2 protein [Cyanobacteriota bacterium]
MNSDHQEASSSKPAVLPFASIIIPTFNGGSRLEAVLKSCLMIKGVAIEILLIDDGSTDGTPERIKIKFPSVKQHRLLRNSGSGSIGRNVGLTQASGRYVKFLDHDDLIQPRGFKVECQEALRSDADIVMSRWGVARIDENGCFLSEERRIFSPPDPSRLIEAILLGEPTPYTAAALYNRSFLGGEQWDEAATMIDDFDWFCRLAIKGGDVRRVDSLSYFWCLHPASIQGRSHQDASIYQKLTFARYRTYGKIEKSLQSSGKLTTLRRQLLAQKYYSFLRCLARYDAKRCWQALTKINRLDQAFCVDASFEPNARAVGLIHAVGLPTFLIGYGVCQRFSDAALSLGEAVRTIRSPVRRPAIQARDKE